MEYSEDNILLDQPLISIENQTEIISQEDISVYEQIIILAFIQHNLKTSPKDDSLYLEINSQLELISQKSKAWLVFSKILYLRSINDLVRTKKAERSILQIQQLIDQYYDGTPDLESRNKYFCVVNYPFHLELQRELAEYYMRLGSVLSSCRLFEQLGMFEDCVECLMIGGQTDKSKELANSLVKNGKESPRIFCCLGDLYNDFQYYKKAWKLSNKRYARAQRSLGRFYFSKGDFETSTKSFEKALKINNFSASSWFTCGCAYLRLEDFKSAVKSFSGCVQIDESNGEAWANLSSSFMNLGKKIEAYSTLEQAVKYCERNWKMWMNLMIIAFENKKFSKFLDCIRVLMNLNQKEIISEKVYEKVNSIMKYYIEFYEKLGIRNMEYIKSKFYLNSIRIEKTYEICCEISGEKFEVWDNYANLCEELHSFNRILFLEKIKKIHLDNDDDNKSSGIKFTLPDDREEKENEKQLERAAELNHKIADMRLKACQCLMIVGWDKDKFNLQII